LTVLSVSGTNKLFLLNGSEPAEFKQPDTTFKTQIFMHSSSSLQTTRLVCLLIAVAGAACPLASKADDTATTTTPAATNMTVAATTPETTNTPEPAPALETTNTPAPATAPETTNTSAVATALATTNPPVAATAPIITNMPAAATVPVPAITPTNVTTMPATATPVTAPPKTPPPYQPFSLGAEAGTTGIGGAASWRFADHFGLVGGADYFSYSMSRTIQSIPYSANLRLMTERAGVNLYPSKDSSFYIGLGAYFNQNRLTGTAISDGSLAINGTPVPAGDSVHLEYKQQPVDPYVAIGGNLYFDKARHFSLGFELGAFYLGNPRVNITTTPSGVVPPADLAASEQKVENDIKKVPVWPILKLSLNYSF
jgi:hypothetical protein